jgi:hypothetical protein
MLINRKPNINNSRVVTIDGKGLNVTLKIRDALKKNVLEMEKILNAKCFVSNFVFVGNYASKKHLSNFIDEVKE